MITRRDFLKVTGVAAAAAALTACGGSSSTASSTASSAAASAVAKLDKVKVAVPNDTTNEARALLLLQENGIIKLKDGVGITATKNDIVENPYNVEIVEAEAAQLPNLLPDVDYAVINSNYAINAGLNPVNDSLLIEGSASAYANILTVKEGNETSPKALALKAALESKQVAFGGEWKTFREMPWGEMYIKPYTGRVLTRAAFTFGTRVAAFKAAAEKMGAVPLKHGDAGYQFDLIGPYRMQIMVWEGDDEFPPNAQVLYSDNFAEGFAAEDRVVAGDILISTIKSYL